MSDKYIVRITKVPDNDGGGCLRICAASANTALSSSPESFGEDWQLTAGEIYDMRPSQAELDATIQSWAY